MFSGFVISSELQTILISCLFEEVLPVSLFIIFHTALDLKFACSIFLSFSLLFASLITLFYIILYLAVYIFASSVRLGFSLACLKISLFTRHLYALCNPSIP